MSSESELDDDFVVETGDTFSTEELLEACQESGYSMPTPNGKQSDTKRVRTSNARMASAETAIKPAESSNLAKCISATRQSKDPLPYPMEQAMSLVNLKTDPETVNLSEQSPTSSHRNKRQKKRYSAELEKEKRMKGDSYLGYEKHETPLGFQRTLTKKRAKRILGPTCHSACCSKTILRSCSQFNQDERKKLFDDFWNTMDWKEKKYYVRSHIDQSEPKNRRVENSRVKNTNIYYLKLFGVKRQVCRLMFLNTLGLKRKQVRGWLLNRQERDQKTTVRTPNAKEVYAKEFLDSLPKLPSHYCRATSDKMYLEPTFTNIIELHKEYKKSCDETGKPAYSRTVFSSVLKSLNMSLYHPKKDKCDICCSNEVGLVNPEDYKIHRQKAESARSEKCKDKVDALDGKCHVITVDVQAVMLSPVLTASSLYYKTKLVVHNYTVYNLATRHTMCYFWDETEAELKASVFATCLRNYLEQNFTDDLPIIIYSDGCTNQNRNATLSNALLDLAMKQKKTLFHKYLEKGHTQSEVDSVHATIERKLRGKDIFVPQDYVKYCADARCKPEPYNIRYMNHLDFDDFSQLQHQRYTSIRPGNKPGEYVTAIRQLQYSAEGTISSKLDYSSEWTAIPKMAQTKFPGIFPKLYQERLKISKRKFKDLQDILPVIPEEYHSFYKSLPV